MSLSVSNTTVYCFVGVSFLTDTLEARAPLRRLLGLLPATDKPRRRRPLLLLLLLFHVDRTGASVMTNVEGSKADDDGDEVGEEGPAGSLCSIVADVEEPEANEVDNNDGAEAGRARGDGVAEDSNEVGGESDSENDGGDRSGVDDNEETVRTKVVLTENTRPGRSA
uniref:Uncharacterized protein n=1 Tax=Oryza meridionalis TaxID=40149 RepID=A0A0E0E900_9ORYZ